MSDLRVFGNKCCIIRRFWRIVFADRTFAWRVSCDWNCILLVCILKLSLKVRWELCWLIVMRCMWVIYCCLSGDLFWGGIREWRVSESGRFDAKRWVYEVNLCMLWSVVFVVLYIVFGVVLLFVRLMGDMMVVLLWRKFWVAKSSFVTIWKTRKGFEGKLFDICILMMNEILKLCGKRCLKWWRRIDGMMWKMWRSVLRNLKEKSDASERRAAKRLSFDFLCLMSDLDDGFVIFVCKWCFIEIVLLLLFDEYVYLWYDVLYFLVMFSNEIRDFVIIVSFVFFEISCFYFWY